jgi:hypothetical protein
MEVQELCWIKISNRFVTSENLNENVDINGVWENIKWQCCIL